MPALDTFEELSLVGLEIDGISWRGERLTADYGSGYGDEAATGAESGLWGWELSSEALPDDEDYGNLINGMPRFEYYRDFIQRHTTGTTAIFRIEFRGKYYHASFAEPEWAGEMHTIDLFSMDGVAVKMRRVRGHAYDSDGAVIQPYMMLDSQDLIDIEGYADNDIAYQWTDNYTPERVASSFGSPTLQTNEINTYPVARFDGVDDYLAYPAGETFTLYDIFIVVKVRSATFAADSGLVSSEVADLLVGDSGTTKFTDLSITNYEYRKNGTLFADNDQQAPMNAFGVIHLRFADGASFPTGVLNLASDTAGSVFCPVDIAAVRAYDTAVPSFAFPTITNFLMETYDLA